MELQELRSRIDEIDAQLTRLFEARMDVAAEIGAWKRENRMPVLDAARERDKLNAIAAESREDMQTYTQMLYSMIFELSRSYQSDLTRTPGSLRQDVERAIEETPRLFPTAPIIACQGTEGAYSQIAGERMFKSPKIMYFKSFDSVFSAIESGFCQYGILPIENSSAGSVKKVYDLMLRHKFYVVRSCRLKIDHNLLAAPGVKKEDIREIFSHQQALDQCAGYLEQFGPDVKITRCENTAMAAEAVAKSERRDIAAIASHDCASLYGLKCLESDIQDRGNNYTRFICISKKLEIYPGANRTTVMMTLPHRPGSLCRALSRFYSLGINITKLESRPLPERDFQFMFYFDLETSVYSGEFGRMIDDLDSISEDFRYLGSYSEVI
ncbi:MAG: prephenate dehydratase domain-containing protein [Eubacteriales bacterium]|nr:prephenate dehydratase domain-containing protein [Eubacteriales bacterium]